jgi:hypothetical protein
MSRRNLLGFFLSVLFIGALAYACSDTPTAVLDEPVPNAPSLGQYEPPNNTDAFGCMGNDVLAYNALATPPEKASWSKTAIPGGNYCTANDIYLAQAVAYQVYNETSGEWENIVGTITCVEGETFRVKVEAQLGQNAASARTDIGVWIAQGPPTQTQAVDGVCNHYNLIPGDQCGNLDDPPDLCGDMCAASGELLDLDLGELTLTCQPNEHNKVEVPACIGWTQPGGDRYCPYPQPLTADINFRMGTVPGNTSKCNCEAFELNIVVLKRAYLEVVKVTNPTGDAGRFNLLIDGGPYATNVGNGGTTGKEEVSAGTNVDPGDTHSFAETAYTGTSLSDYEISWECRDRGGAVGSRGTGTGPGPEDLFLMPDDDVLCTFTNARKPELKIVKVFDPTTDGGKVSFTVAGTLYDNATNGYGHNGDTGWIQFAIGQTVAFSEAGFGGTDLADYDSSLLCSKTPLTNTGTAGSVMLAAGDKVTCTFTNRAKPKLTLIKVVVGGSLTVADFPLYVDALQVTSGVKNIFAVGSYLASEDEQPGYMAGDWTGDCDAVGNVTLAYGDDKTCTITNTVMVNEGCTPGYWKTHYESWVGYTPGQSFFGVFAASDYRGLDAGLTLGQAIDLGGGGFYKLARSAVAALLNAANPDVSYYLTQQQIIDAVVAAFNSGDPEPLATDLDYGNNEGCPID